MVWVVLVLCAVAGASANAPSALFANNSGVFLFNSSSATVEPLLGVMRGATAVAYRFSKGEVYALIPGKRIVRIKILPNLNSPSAEKKEDWCFRDRKCTDIVKQRHFLNPHEIVSELCKDADNMVVDWEGDRIYWTCNASRKKKNDSLATVTSAATDGSNKTTIVLDTDPIYGLAVDPYDKKLFWLKSDKVCRMGLLGEYMEYIHTFGKDTTYLSDIVLDMTKKIVYVTGGMQGREGTFLGKMGYDGSGYEELYSCKGQGWDLGLGVVNSKVFWLTEGSKADCLPFGLGKGADLDLEVISVPQIEYENVTAWKVFDVAVQTRPTSVASAVPSGALSDVTGTAVAMETPSGGGGAVVTASSDEMTALYLVVVVILVSVFMVVLLAKQRARTGNYRPASPDDRSDTL